MSVTHITGLVVVVNGRAIQRCALCGEKLLDSNGVMMLLNPDGSRQTFATWQHNRLLRYDGRGQFLLDAGVPLPDDSCISMVEN